MAGFIYIMSNPAFGNLIKIGKSDFDPVKRRDELANTSVPDDFKIEYYAFLENHHQIEVIIHKSLNQFRHKNNREFFNCEVHMAAKLIKDIAKNKLKYEEINYSINENQKNNTSKDLSKNFYSKKIVIIILLIFFILIYFTFLNDPGPYYPNSIWLKK